jgi:cytochrome c biogenesis protein CcmG/thiol:disulfide interchange protein DsbE
MAKLARFLPIVFGIGFLALFAVGLTLGPPQEIESAYQDKALPAFALDPLFESGEGLTTKSLQSGAPVLLNIFASWCAPCRAEHGLLMQLQQRNVPIYAINYKDGRAAAQRFLNRLGNPYRAIGFDRKGAIALDLGVYGVPETFIIDGAGHVQMRHVGPLTPQDVREKILPYFTDKSEERENALSR